MAQLPSDYLNERNALDREVAKQPPGTDLLQFCATFFQRRLESQRAEHRLAQHSSSAESSFPGSNPFGTTSASSTPAATTSLGPGGMHSVTEEDEHDFASPTASTFPPNARAASPPPNMASNNTAAAFGNFGFAPGRAPDGAAPASRAMDQPPSFPSNYNMNRRTSVSAESLAPAAADDSSWKAPAYPKTQQQVARLRAAVAHNFLFSHLDDDQSAQVLGALQERKVPAKDVRVIVQGDAGDYFYVVESGSFDIYVSATGKVEPGAAGLGHRVATSAAGSSFGELALMYNAPRAATVVSTEPAVLWQLDRITFRRILMDSAFQRRRMYESFLEEVPLFSGLTAYERSKIADALETTKFPAGSTIIREGDVGDRFYIVEAGEAEVHKRGHAKPLKAYRKGDYFGELALLDDKPRAASVLAHSDMKVATLGKDGFQRLLGPVEAIMRRDDPSRAG
ncbi:hypothetical protein LTR08_003027 [Meristemomyces frigidus]|nr:hypothetical protein LTR08_003027 [Meristemomyces frigidus]